jgi:hypothetical protein
LVYETAKAILEVADSVGCVVDALLDRAVERVPTAGEDLGQERVGGIFFGPLVVDQDLGQGDLGDVLPRLLVDHAYFFTFVEEFRDPLQRDVATCLGVVELAVGIPLDQDCHSQSLAGREATPGRVHSSMSNRWTLVRDAPVRGAG